MVEGEVCGGIVDIPKRSLLLSISTDWYIVDDADDGLARWFHMLAPEFVPLIYAPPSSPGWKARSITTCSPLIRAGLLFS
ncbi:hypothetical protein KC348_g79 [Hortaea werneckii]|nr:hypothetical protein KC348_g79 [Hortaea werneckii]